MDDFPAATVNVDSKPKHARREKGRPRKRAAQAARVAANTDKAFGLRLSGLSHEAIGERLGLTRERVGQMINGRLALLNERTNHSAAQLHQLQLSQFAQLYLAHWPNRKNPKNAKIMIQCLENRGRLLGLEAAAKLEIVAPMAVAGHDIDLSKLTDEEVGWLEVILRKAGPQADPAVVATQGPGERGGDGTAEPGP